MRALAAAILFQPAVAVAGPFSGFHALGAMGIDDVDATGLSDTTFVQQITDTGTVGPGIECELIPPYVSGDFSDASRTLTVAVNTSWAAWTFNGLRFELTDPNAPDLGTPYIVGTNIPGFDLGRVAVRGSRVALNFQGMNSVGYVTLGFEPPPDLTVRGACPGATTLIMEHFTPGGQVAVVRGTALVPTPVPGGQCAGTPLSLRPRSVLTLTANNQGDVRLPLNLPAQACGQVVQALDLDSCQVTPGVVLR